MAEKKYTPMMMHYIKLKEENPDSILFYRLGDFYEMFFEDAKIASQELNLVLTGRSAVSYTHLKITSFGSTRCQTKRIGSSISFK